MTGKTAPNDALAELARQAAEQLPLRTPERRAAAAAYVELAETKTVDAARKALAGFVTDPSVRYAATVLLRQLAEQDATPDGGHAA